MRIGIIGSRGYPSTYGGFETLVRVLAPYLAARDHDVIVYGRGDAHRHRLHDAGGGVKSINVIGLRSKSLSTLSTGLAASLDSTTRGCDVALVLNVANGLFLPILKGRGIPTVVNVDGLEWEREKWGKIAKRVFRNGANATARWATRLIADSQAIAEIWANEFSREPVFIPYGGTIQSRTGGSRAFRDLKLKSSDYVLVVARLAPENNVDLALDAIEMFEQRPELIVVGSANYANETERRLHALQKAGKAKWLGHVADQELLNDLWSHCGAYVHGHSVGGTNPALVQALAAGAPTLALATEFNREVIGNQQQLYEPNRDDLARKLKQLLKDSGLRERFVRHGQARVAANYQWKDVCAAYLDELSRAASSTR